MTLEEYFRTQKVTFQGVVYPAVEHTVRVQVSDDEVTFYIHPSRGDGNTCDFQVNGNVLIQNPHVTIANNAS